MLLFCYCCLLFVVCVCWCSYCCGCCCGFCCGCGVFFFLRALLDTLEYVPTNVCKVSPTHGPLKSHGGLDVGRLLVVGVPRRSPRPPSTSKWKRCGPYRRPTHLRVTQGRNLESSVCRWGLTRSDLDASHRANCTPSKFKDFSSVISVCPTR